uniref:Uncharacterized protein n=1 Tax=uncultured Candidatus Melainabacteria bacterium TaxID=2682970 RepID=A0A650EJG9_9BACT|nr:hypothetical protein Melaina855_2360 [uncultured Candidatus Melainabacteria bacterium]
MSLRIPVANTNNVMSRNFVKQMASDGFLPVIALEAFVEGGRTLQAYNRGGFDEARERITEEFSGAVFWLGGVSALNWVFEKFGQKVLKLPNHVVDIASDGVRKPLANYLEHERTKDGARILEKTMARFKFAKVISSVLIANAFIGFVLPKINQAITRSYHKNKPENAIVPEQNIQTPNPFVARPMIDSFAPKENNDKKKDVSFGLNLLSIANKFESDRNYKLLAVDAGTASGRAYSARNNDERIEILFRDLGSIFFYMFNMQLMNNWLNKIEQKGLGTRLDPVSAEFATKYMEEYFKSKGNAAVNIETFRKEMLGADKEIPDTLKSKFEGDKIKIISLEGFKKELTNFVPAEKVEEFAKVSDEMSKLQPQVRGLSILTEGQVRDILNGGHLNNPEFLQEFFKNRFGSSFMEKYKFVAQNDLDAHKKELINYVNSIIEKAKSGTGEITEAMVRKASNTNLKMNALNWGAGFAVSALFLSTIIPKLQYMITKWRTGSDAFPGTKEFQEQEAKKAA